MTISQLDDVTWTPSWMDIAGFVPFTLGATAGQTGRYGVLPSPADWPAVGDGLRMARHWLKELPLPRIAEAIDAAAARWSDRAFRPRCDTVDAATRITGMPAATVERALDASLSGLRLPCQFPEQPGSAGVTLTVLNGAIPGSAARLLVRPLLARSAVIARIPAREAGFTAAFLRTLHDIEPVVADAVLVTHWRRDDAAALRGAFAQADAACVDHGGRAATLALPRRRRRR